MKRKVIRLAPGRWHHISILNGTQLYVNGKLVKGKLDLNFEMWIKPKKRKGKR